MIVKTNNKEIKYIVERLQEEGYSINSIEGNLQTQNAKGVVMQKEGVQIDITDLKEV